MGALLLLPLWQLLMGVVTQKQFFCILKRLIPQQMLRQAPLHALLLPQQSLRRVLLRSLLLPAKQQVPLFPLQQPDRHCDAP